jgi:hypothetical protein
MKKNLTPQEKQEAILRDSWRVFRILSEFVDGFETMTDIGPSVSIFGSARLPRDHRFYKLAEEVGAAIARKGFAVITGGGPGIMEAANKGAQSAKGRSCGLSVVLPKEWEPNPYIDNDFNLRFRYFFVRKVMFIRYAQAYVFLPGGVGTLDELFEALTLIQTEKSQPFPIYLVGKEFWKELFDWLRRCPLHYECISEEDLERMILTDDPEEIAKGIEEHYERCRAIQNF